MTMHRRFLVAVIALLASGAAAGVFAADLAAGKAKAAEVCAACHGADGNSAAADFPRIGGQYADYLAKALQEYRSGERSHPSMRAISASLSDQDMADLAAYYAQGGVKTASK